MFYPATGVLAFSEHLLGLVPIAAPIIALTHQPLIGHNVAFIATFVLSALGAHFLAYTMTRRHDVSAVAAVAFAFAPYRLPQTPHIQVLASYWTPVCLAALHRYDRTARPRWADHRGRGLGPPGALVRLLPALPRGAGRALVPVVRDRPMAGAAVRHRGGRVRRRRAAARAVPLGIPGHPPRHLRLQALDRGDPVLQRGHRRTAVGERRAARVGMGQRLPASGSRTCSRASPSCSWPAWRCTRRSRSGPTRPSPAGCSPCAGCSPASSSFCSSPAPSRSFSAGGSSPIGGCSAAVDRARRQAADAGAGRGARVDGAAAAGARGVPPPIGAGLLSARRLCDVGVRPRAGSRR